MLALSRTKLARQVKLHFTLLLENEQADIFRMLLVAGAANDHFSDWPC